MNKYYKFLKVILINCVILIFLLAIIEGSFYALRPINDISWVEFRKSKPEPYLYSDYFSKEFIDLSAAQPGGYAQWGDDASIILPNNFNSKYFNVINNRRVTTGNKNNYKKIYIFGGSTVYDSEVPDNLTIASLLQSKINAEEKKYDVINMGVSTIHSGQELGKLKKTVTLNPKDIVIFYDGANDVTQRVYYGNNQGWILNEVKETPKFIVYVRYLARYSSFFSYVDREYLTRNHFEFQPKIYEIAANNYENIVKEAHEYTINKGAFFYHFLQPTLATKFPLNDYEKKLILYPNLVSPSGLLALRSTYPKFKDVLSLHKYSYDLAHIFNDLPTSPYLDIVHVTEVGNLVIADSIYQKIYPQLNKN